ncbi:MAG: penicillin-binding protein activator [Gammaproteobacteria bacterium]
MQYLNYKHLLFVLLLLLLNACATPPPVKTSTVSDRFLAAADNRAAAGDYEGAVDNYLRAAAVASDEERQGILLQAAGSLMDLGEVKRAMTILDRITLPYLSAGQRQHYKIVQAQIAYSQHRPDRVLSLLTTVPDDNALKADYYWLRAEALQQNREFIASIHDRIVLDPLLVDQDKRLANHMAIWTALTSLTDEELQQLRSAPPPDELSGWIELVELSRLYLQEPDMLVDVIPHWESRYPDHPAREAFTAKLAGGMRIAGQPPQQLALLLPLSGKLAQPAAAIRDGVLAAYYDTPQDTLRPAIRIYDTGGHAGSILETYRQAVNEGAQFVIGPLRKAAVQQLASQPMLAVPVLTLNAIDDDTLNTTLFQFGLAPEDEAREVARRAWLDGHRKAIALIPEGSWGERIFAAYLEEWQTLGGRVLEVGYYNATETDHGTAISAALNLDSSKARHQQLVRMAGQTLEFEPRRRQDVDMIFMLATPRQARLINPQLSFYRASRLPVYATSHVYTGYPDSSVDADLNNVAFCDMPWMLDGNGARDYLQDNIKEYWPTSAARYGRFHALGIDAWRVIPYIDQLENSLMGTYQGVTGNLTIDANHQIHRSLDWAHFKQGLPSRLPSRMEIMEPALAGIP